MRQLLNDALQQCVVNEQITNIRGAIDYELTVLFEAMKRQDQMQIETSKERLNRLRVQLLTEQD